MALQQRKTLFDRPRDPYATGRKPSGKGEFRDTVPGLDGDIRKMLADYLSRYSADDSIIEAKGKLIQYIRSI
jgi:hypothetical protein